MRKIFILIILSCLNILAIAQKSKSQQLIESLIKKEKLDNASIGIMAINMRGKVIAKYQADKKLLPASNMKLISTGLALRLLGSQHKFATKIAYSGKIINNSLDGNLYIIGGGDPSLFSKEDIALSDSSILEIFLKDIKDKGINTINGLIIGDARYFNDAVENSNWAYQDIGTYYGSGASGLNFYKNCLDIEFKTLHSRLDYSITYPDCPWLELSSNAGIGDRYTGDKLYMYGNDFSYKAQIRGTLGEEYKEKLVGFSNKYPALTTAYYLAKFLSNHGINCYGISQINGFSKASDIFNIKNMQFCYANNSERDILNKMKSDIIIDTSKLHYISTVYSPNLKELCKVCNHISDNIFAEAIFKEIAKQLEGESSYDKATTIIEKALNQLGLVTHNAIDISDGSGLSRKNRVSAKFFCSFLKSMAQSPVIQDYIYTLERAGNGEYKNLLKKYPKSIKDRIHLKSGTMNGVKCYSGYIDANKKGKNNRIVFSIMINNSSEPKAKIANFIDRILYSLAKEN